MSVVGLLWGLRCQISHCMRSTPAARHAVGVTGYSGCCRIVSKAGLLWPLTPIRRRSALSGPHLRAPLPARADPYLRLQRALLFRPCRLLILQRFEVGSMCLQLSVLVCMCECM